MKQQAVFCLVLALSIGIGAASAGESNTKYFAFVGEKVSLEPVPPDVENLRRDREFLAKYRVLEPVYGVFNREVIEFTVFDHYGNPRFAEHRHVLLYVEYHDGKYYHSKYMYSPLYKTVKGRWAGPYDAYDYNHENNRKLAIKPEIIDFADQVTVDISEVPPEQVGQFYPAPYYRIEGLKAIAVYGNYLPELFRLKQHGVLRARGDFQ